MVTGTYKERTLHILDTLFQQLLAVFVLLVLWEAFNNLSFNNKHAWHVVLCTIGIGLLMAEGLLLFNKESSFLKDVDRPTKGTIHAVIMLLSCTCLTIGIALKISQKSQSSIAKHFSTAHGILGLVSWILVFISVILGGLVGLSKQVSTLGRPSLYKIIHVLIGVSAYIIGVVSLGFGLHYLVEFIHGRNTLIVFLALYVGYSLIGSIKSCYNHFFG